MSSGPNPEIPIPRPGRYSLDQNGSFEALAANLEHTIETLARDERGDLELDALRPAKVAADRGAELARKGMESGATD